MYLIKYGKKQKGRGKNPQQENSAGKCDIREKARESDFREKSRKNVTLVKSAAKGDCYASISAHISGLSLSTFPAGFKNRFNVSLALKLVAFLALTFTSDCFVQLFLLST